jgi:LL-diaminopimelate aminotransferase
MLKWKKKMIEHYGKHWRLLILDFQRSTLAEDFQTSVFSELAQYKRQQLEAGKTITDLSIGSPDLPPPPFIIESLTKHVQNVDLYGYPLHGIDRFHQAVQQFYQKNYKVTLNTENEILQLMGSQDGLVHLPMTLLNEGDTMLVPDPGYPAYEAGATMAKAKMYAMPLQKENDFLPDLDQIPKDIAKKAKLMVLNFPGNPVPALASKEFFKNVVQFAKENSILVIHDFAYSELVFDNGKAVSFLEIDGAKDVGVEFHSLSKSFNMAGCRVGFLCGNEKVIETLKMLKSNLDYGVFLPIQHAASDALLYGEQFLKENNERYERRRNVLVDGLRRIGWNVDKPKASMFIWTEVPHNYTSKQFVYELMDRAGVVVTPGSAFGAHGEGYVRIALVQDEKQLRETVERIKVSKIF